MLERQFGLMEGYRKIKSDLGVTWATEIPVDINSREGQADIRLTAHYFWEEMYEFCLSYQERGLDNEATLEELSDCIHFWLEWAILTGTDKDISQQYWRHGVSDKGDKLDFLYRVVLTQKTQGLRAENVEQILYQMFMSLASSTNQLKNKPWKQKIVITNKDAFLFHSRNFMYGFIFLIMELKMKPQNFYDLYFIKAEKNQERQTNGY